jgi:hypothetical protein
VTALVQGLAPALSDGSRLSWAAPSSLHEGLGFRAIAPDRIQGDAAKPRFDEAQSGIMFARPRRRLLRPQRASLAPRSPRSSPLRAASGGDLRSGLTAPARGAADSPRSGRRNALRSNKETASPSIRSPLTDGLIQGRGGWAHRSHLGSYFKRAERVAEPRRVEMKMPSSADPHAGLSIVDAAIIAIVPMAT